MKPALYYFILFFIPFCNINAQLNANSVLKLHEVTETEMNAIVSPNEGSLIYNSDDDGVYKYNGSNWFKIDNSLETIILDRVNVSIPTANDNYFDFPVNATHIQSIDTGTFQVFGDGAIRVLQDGVYLMSAELSVSDLAAGDTKYIVATFLNGTDNPGDIMAYLNRGFVSLPSTDWWGATGVLMYNLSANDIVRFRYVLNTGGATLSGRFVNIGMSKIK